MKNEQDKWDASATVDALPVELPALHGDPVLGDGHAQILHRQHSPALARTARASASEPGTLDAEVRIAFAALCALAGLPPPGTGPNQTPPHLARLLALATQKFVSDIAADSYQFARIRASNSSSASNPMGSLNAASGLTAPAAGAGAGAAGGAAGVSGGESGKGKAGTHLGIQRPGFGGGGSGGSGQGRTVLTMEDLGMAVSEYGVSVKRGEFYR